MSFPTFVRYPQPPTQWENLPTWLVSLLARPAAPHLVFNLIGFTSLPAEEIIQTNQSHPPMETRGHLTLLLLQSLTPTVPAP